MIERSRDRATSSMEVGKENRRAGGAAEKFIMRFW
jgi:hypothetical protein